MNLSGIANSIQKLAVKNSPAILIGLGIASMATCVYLSVKATPKSTEVWVAKEYEVDEAVYYHADTEGYRLKDQVSTAEYAKILFKDFTPIWGPVALAAITSIGLFVAANRIQTKRQEMLVVAYTLGEKALTTYQRKVIDTVGNKKHLEVIDKIAEDEMVANPYSADDVINTTYGDHRFYDEWSGRYFLSDINKVRKAENEIITRLSTEMCLTVNDYYYELGLPPTKSGAIVGWDVNDIMLDVKYSPIFDSEEHPCTSLSYLVGVLESRYQIL